MPATTFQEDIAESPELNPHDRDEPGGKRRVGSAVRSSEDITVSPPRARLKEEKEKEENGAGQLQLQERFVSHDRSLEGAARTNAPKCWGNFERLRQCCGHGFMRVCRDPAATCAGRDRHTACTEAYCRLYIRLSGASIFQ